MLSRSIDIASDAVFWLDKNARFVYVNRSACISIGYEQKELLSMTLFDVNPRVTPESWNELLKQIRIVGTGRLESEHRRKDGTLFPVEIVSTFIVFNGREYINGFARDITERRRSESALRARVSELSALRSYVTPRLTDTAERLSRSYGAR
jgi:PAS domain S-box-containing protein